MSQDRPVEPVRSPAERAGGGERPCTGDQSATQDIADLTAAGASTRSLTGVDAAARARLMRALQRSHGNRAAQALVSRAPVVQRDGPRAAAPPPPPAPAPASSTAPATAQQLVGPWQAPLGLGAASDVRGAGILLIRFQLEVISLRDALDEAEREPLSSVVRSIQSLVPRFHEEGPLEQRHRSDLNAVTLFGMPVYNEWLGVLRRRTALALPRIVEPDTSATRERLEAELHLAFTNGQPSRLAQLKEALSAVDEYRNRAVQVATWARRAAAGVQAASTASGLDRAIAAGERLGNVVEKLNACVTAASVVTRLTGFDRRAVGEGQRAIDDFRLALDVIDVAMTFTRAVPIIGTLWSDFYRPMTDQILNGLSVLTRQADTRGRELASFSWMERHAGRDDPPMIPPEYRRHFPGGQPVFAFLWRAAGGGSPSVTPEVERFFLEHRHLFNAGQDRFDQLEEQSNWRLFNPSTWGAGASSPNLLPWVQRHARTVWIQLYGTSVPYRGSG